VFKEAIAEKPAGKFMIRSRTHVVKRHPEGDWSRRDSGHRRTSEMRQSDLPEISREKASASVVYLADGTNRIYAWRPHTTASHPTVPKWMQ
jgi:hypothetical protein